MASIGINSVIGIISHIFFIAITWRLMLSVNFDVLISKNRIDEVRLLYIFFIFVFGNLDNNYDVSNCKKSIGVARLYIIFLIISIVTLLSNFVLDIIIWTLDIPLLF